MHVHNRSPQHITKQTFISQDALETLTTKNYGSFSNQQQPSLIPHRPARRLLLAEMAASFGPHSAEPLRDAKHNSQRRVTQSHTRAAYLQNQASSAEPDARQGDSAVRPSVRLSSVNAPLFHSRTVNPGAPLDEAEHSLCESEPPLPVQGVLHRRTVTLAQLGGSYQPRSRRLIAHCAARESFCVQTDSRKNLRSWSSPKRSRSVTSSLPPPPLPPPPTLAQSLSLPKASLLPNGSYASLPSPPTLFPLLRALCYSFSAAHQ